MVSESPSSADTTEGTDNIFDATFVENMGDEFVDGDEPTFTVDDAIEHFGFGKFQVLISLFAGVSWMAEAMEMLILSILAPALACEWGISHTQQALITSCVFAGMTFSSTIWGNVCDRFGRRIGLLLIALSTFILGMMSAFANSYSVFIIIRTLTGVAIGGVPQSITYYSEFLPIKHRAKCVILMQGFWALGGAVESVIAMFVMEALEWRWLLGISTFPLLISAASCLFIPESARFLITNGRNDEAYRTLETVARLNSCQMPRGRLVAAKGSEEHESHGSVFDLFNNELFYTTIFLLPIWFISTFCYYGIILYTTVLYTSGDTCHGGEQTNTTSALCTPLTNKDYFGFIITSVAEFPGLLLSAFLLEIVGRKKTMAINMGIYAVVILFLFICFERYVVTALIFVTRAFASGAFQSAYVYTPEVYPTTMRAVGLGAASGLGRFGALLTPFIAHVLAGMWLQAPVIVYGGSAFLAAIFALALPIETRGRHMRDRLGQSSSSAVVDSVLKVGALEDNKSKNADVEGNSCDRKFSG